MKPDSGMNMADWLAETAMQNQNKNLTENPSHRPLREGEIIQEGDEYETCQGGWYHVPKSWVGKPVLTDPMRRPAGKG